jgi:hypothetical protein
MYIPSSRGRSSDHKNDVIPEQQRPPFRAPQHKRIRPWRMVELWTLTQSKRHSNTLAKQQCSSIQWYMVLKTIITTMLIVLSTSLLNPKLRHEMRNKTISRLQYVHQVSYMTHTASFVSDTTTKSTKSTITNRRQASPRTLNQILYTGSFGIGHRMNKLSSVYHLLVPKDDNSNDQYTDFCKYISMIQVEWGTCPDSRTNDIDIFDYLFASQYIHIPDVSCSSDDEEQGYHDIDNPKLQGNKTIWIRNDVTGYYAGQSYKNAKVTLDNTMIQSFHSKTRSDYQFFQYMIQQRFIGWNQVRQYQIAHHWDNHYVFGVHIRAGNGEMDHFIQSGRNGFQNNHPEQIAQHIALSIHHIVQKLMSQRIDTKPPLVFVATDTEYYITALTHALIAYNIPTISFHEQPRIPAGMGVSYERSIYETQTNVSCLQSWYGSMMDMTILSQTNTVVATSRSTFTQILPNSIVFHRDENRRTYYKYCEMDVLFQSQMSKVTCFTNYTSWLLRNNRSEWDTMCINCSTSLDHLDNEIDAVTHKLMVHLPDVVVDGGGGRNHKSPMYTNVIAFLESPNVLSNNTVYYYGKKYNGKYRTKATETMQRDWTWGE